MGQAYGARLGLPRICGARPGCCLSEGGRADAANLAVRLADLPIRAIYRSPMQRAGETGAHLAACLGLEPRVLPEIDEVNFGVWTGRTVDELESAPEWRRWNAARSTSRAHGGEMMLEVQTRVAGAIERHRRQHDSEMIALFSHGDVIRAAMDLMLGERRRFVPSAGDPRRGAAAYPEFP